MSLDIMGAKPNSRQPLWGHLELEITSFTSPPQIVTNFKKGSLQASEKYPMLSNLNQRTITAETYRDKLGQNITQIT